MDDFKNDISAALSETTADAKAWLGALQFAVYSRADQDKETRFADEDTGHVVTVSVKTWFENTKNTLEIALKNADSALNDEWTKRKDPRHDTPDAHDEFAHGFESKIATIARLVFNASDVLQAENVIQTRHAREALEWVQADLKKMIDVYAKHGHEMTDGPPDNLLGIRARIMHEASKSL
jgi:hypothetical protein